MSVSGTKKNIHSFNTDMDAGTTVEKKEREK